MSESYTSQRPKTARALDPELVSIITPVFNSEAYIEMTIRSVFAQTYPKWEMLVLIDNGSKDRTAEIVKQMAALDPRVQLVQVPGGRSCSDARNHGFKMARGRYIAFLDADDLWLPHKLDKQLKFIRSTGAALTYTNFRRISADGQQVGYEIRAPEGVVYTDLLKVNSVACMSAMVDQEQTGPLHMETSAIAEDFLLWLRIVKAGHTARGLQEDLARYRIHDQSRSPANWGMLKIRWRVYREFERLSVLRSIYYLGWYAGLALMKRKRF